MLHSNWIWLPSTFPSKCIYMCVCMCGLCNGIRSVALYIIYRHSYEIDYTPSLLSSSSSPWALSPWTICYHYIFYFIEHLFIYFFNSQYSIHSMQFSFPFFEQNHEHKHPSSKLMWRSFPFSQRKKHFHLISTHTHIQRAVFILYGAILVFKCWTYYFFVLNKNRTHRQSVFNIYLNIWKLL